MLELPEPGRSGACACQSVDRGAFEFDGERLAIGQGLLAFPCRLLAVLSGCCPVLGCECSVGGCLSPVLSGALSVLGGAGDEHEAAHRACGRVLLGGSVELGHRQIPGSGGLVAGECGEIAEVRDRVALRGGPQTITGGLLALRGGALTDVTAELVRRAIDAGCEIVIAGRLVAVGRDLVALRAALITVSGAVIAVRERLVSLAGGLIGLG